MGDSAARVPTATDTLVVLPIFLVGGLAILRTGAIHAVEAQAIEVLLCVLLRLEDRRLPIQLAASEARGLVIVRECLEATDDLLSGRVAPDILDRKDIDLSERIEVLADGRVPTGTLVGVEAQEVSRFLVERLVQRSLKAAASMVDGTWSYE